MKNHFDGVVKAFAISIFVFVLAGCSNGKKTVPKLYKVEIKAMQFQPAQLSVQKGDTVLFINQDILVHNVTEEKTKAWGSQDLSPGKFYKMVVTKNSDYYCSLHPVMKGKLIVE
jgi:plastocyanin